TDTNEARLGVATAQRSDQSGTKDIPRCLSGYDRDGNLAGADWVSLNVRHRQSPADSTDDAAIRSPERGNQRVHHRNAGKALLELFEGLLGRQALSIDNLVGTAQSQEFIFTEPTALQTFDIHAMGLSRLATGHNIVRNVLKHNTAPGRHTVGTNMTGLVHHGAAPQNGEIPYRDMAGQSRAVSKNGMITHHTVMGHVHISHQKIVTADASLPPVLGGSPVNGAVLADDVVVTNDQCGWLSGVLFVLALLTDTGELENAVILANNRRAFDDHVGSNFGTFTDFHTRADIAPGANGHTVRQFG